MRRPSGALALAIMSAAVVGLDLDIPVVRPVSALLLLLALPAVVLFRAPRFLDDHAPARALFALGSTLLGVILLGLALNVALPLVGVERPLQPAVIGVAALVANLALLGWRGNRTPLLGADPVGVWSRVMAARLELPPTLAVGSLVLAVAGAVRLNNGAGGGVAVAALALGAAALLALLLRPRGTAAADARTLGLVALALLLATSLRGWSITGHDVQSEFLAFTLTNGPQHWAIGSWQNAYNACLSITILPSMLVQATGLSGTVVFKVLLQLVFALVPVLNFLLARRFLPRRLALAAAICTLALPTFYTDMPYLVRQEVAFFFLALMLLAVTRPAGTVGRCVPAAVFGVGVVLSHYSTTYVMLLGLGTGLVMLGGWRLFRRFRPPQSSAATSTGRAPLTLLNPLLIVFLALVSWTWAGPVTHTGGHAAEVARDSIAAIFGTGGGGPAASDASYSFWSHDQASARQRLDLFVGQTLKVRATVPKDVPLFRHPDRAMLRPRIVDAGQVSPTALGSRVDHLGLDPGVAVTGGRVAGAALVQLLLLLGLVRLLRARRRGGRASVPEEAVFVTIGTGVALGLMVLIPQLSVDYGVLRGFEQALLVVSPVIAAGLWWVVRPLRSARTALVAAVPVALLVVFSGLLASTLGGYSPRLALANNGLYYDRYSASASDLQAIDWATAAARGTDPAPRIVANRNIGVRVLTADPRAVVDDRLFPTLLAHGDYVFIDSRLQATRRSAVFYTGDLISYRYPLGRVERRLDLVYSSGQTRIYR
jgi:uncharacterized membrane protein